MKIVFNDIEDFRVKSCIGDISCNVHVLSEEWEIFNLTPPRNYSFNALVPTYKLTKFVNFEDIGTPAWSMIELAICELGLDYYQGRTVWSSPLFVNILCPIKCDRSLRNILIELNDCTNGESCALTSVYIDKDLINQAKKIAGIRDMSLVSAVKNSAFPRMFLPYLIRFIYSSEFPIDLLLDVCKELCWIELHYFFSEYLYSGLCNKDKGVEIQNFLEFLEKKYPVLTKAPSALG